MKQRNWVRITAVFFALMVVMTIFSRASFSATKAKVTVAHAERQTISHEISLTGTVEAKDYSLQYVPAGLMVKSVKISPGQSVEAGDVLFTVDTKKIQEELSKIREEIAQAEAKNDVLISRAEKSLRDARENAKEEKSLAYDEYRKAAEAYKKYKEAQKRGNHKESGKEQDAQMTAEELKNARDAAKSASEMTAREQEKIVEAAEDSLRQTKEDIRLAQSTKDLETREKELRPYLRSNGKYLAENAGVVGRIFVESGCETAAGVAVTIADVGRSVRLTADVPEEYREKITASSTVTIKGENAAGDAESYEVTDASVTKNNAQEPDAAEVYSLTADVPSELFPVGSSVAVTVCNGTKEYDTCVPLRCLRQSGTNQYFIYVAEEQDTVLGKELTAQEMTVTVLDKNESYAAIGETISGEQQVIASVNKDIVDGSRVRIIE